MPVKKRRTLESFAMTQSQNCSTVVGCLDHRTILLVYSFYFTLSLYIVVFRSVVSTNKKFVAKITACLLFSSLFSCTNLKMQHIFLLSKCLE